VLEGPATSRGLGGFLRPEEEGVELGEKVLLLRRAVWLRGQRGLRELTVTTFPGGVADCSSWVGLTEAVELVFPSGAWDRNGPQQKPDSACERWFRERGPELEA